MTVLTKLLMERKRVFKSLTENPYDFRGLYRGFVLSIDDPEERGRVQVRVPSVHGGVDNTVDDDLPWAEVLVNTGGANDCGSYMNPYVGSRVFVAFEEGHPEFPIIVGGFRSVPDEERRLLVAEEDTNNPAGNEIPLDVTGSNDTRIIWNKTWKGHTIICEEAANEESIRIIDSGGNILEMKTPIPAEGGDDRRGAGNAIDGGAKTAFDIEGESHILFKDIGGQEIRMKVTRDDPLVPEIVLETTGMIRIGSAISSVFPFALAGLLDTTLRACIVAIQNHIHPGGTIGPGKTGPPDPTTQIPSLAPKETWQTNTTFGKVG